MPTNEEAPSQSFLTQKAWRTERPHILVVACSDGRYQQSLDEFLVHHLNIHHYDRLYGPGGPGALVSNSFSYFRGEQFRQEKEFLIRAHLLQEILLIFHGAAVQEGPKEAACADYLRKMPYATMAEIHRQQEADLKEAVESIHKWDPGLKVRAFRAEVMRDHRVHFVPLETETA